MNKSNIPLHELPEKDTEIVVREISYRNGYNTQTMHRHSYYELMLFKTGGGSQLIDLHSHKILPHSIYLICPGQLHLMKKTPEANGLLIQFSADCPALFSLNPGCIEQVARPAVPEEEFKSCYDLALQISHYSKQSLSGSRLISRHYLAILLLKISLRHAEHPPLLSSADTLLYHRFSTFAEENFRNIRTIKTYEEKLGVSFKKLNSIIKRKTGKTALQMIHHRLLMEIKRMLLYGDLSQKQISYELNFDSTASFNQFVKKLTSYTPNELKQRLKTGHLNVSEEPTSLIPVRRPGNEQSGRHDPCFEGCVRYSP